MRKKICEEAIVYLAQSSSEYHVSRKNSKPFETSVLALKSSLAFRIFLASLSVNPGLPEIIMARSTYSYIDSKIIKYH